SKALPRVYDLALEAISHGDGRVDSETLGGFVLAYQSVSTLTLGELWAIPIMLRLALLENLRRVGARITEARIHLNLAQDWANRMMAVAESDPKSLILVIADMARSDPPMVSPFIAELARRLQGHGSSLALPLTWIEQRLAESSLTVQQMVLTETQQQVADQVSVSNSIGCLRSLGATDWRIFVEAMSSVEHVLRNDVDGIYGAMDFTTRDRYRRVVARLALSCGLSETAVAHAAISLVELSRASGKGSDQTMHVGYYLIDEGLAELEVALPVKRSAFARLFRRIGQFPLTLYVGSILAITLLLAMVLLTPLRSIPFWQLFLTGIVALLAATQLATALVNWWATLWTRPELLPRMDYVHGLPANLATLVVIPTLLSGEHQINALIEALEVRYLGNQDDQLYFGLLTDFRDAAEQIMHGDASLLACAGDGIRRLNEKYPQENHDRFYLLHRPRQWDTSQRIWMGYERKRGKIADLNALLRGGGLERFSLVVGDLKVLATIKYVITLDTDTQLPRDSARKFVGAMAHPLNRPRYDESRQRVVAGYGILQPRMAASLSGADRSRYGQVFGSEPGIDPYTRSVSDVYQDLFGEGSFMGKGIYDVDAFEQALKERFPENRILSHDLLEGCYARSGLISDVHLYDEYPGSYAEDICRQQRWIRGDWQIAHWLLPHVPGPQGSSVPNPLSVLARWKILDNLRRSLVPMALVLLLLVGWTLASHAFVWTLEVLGVILVPPLLMAIVEFFGKSDDVLLWQHLTAVTENTGHNLVLAAFRIACLPHEARISLNAIIRSCWRMLISHRHLLEWRDAGSTFNSCGIVGTYLSMWACPAVVGAVLVLAWLRPIAWLAATPVLALWLAAPALAWWLSLPLRRRDARLSHQQQRFLRHTARKTWLFFERFVVEEDNWLPPDNFQELPVPVIAHRTSPTNIGLSLLANLAATDFGYITTTRLLERTSNTFRSMALLERQQGHFYNWYDTRTLQPMPPRYISSVDSGNLAGHLLTLRAGLLSLPEQPIVSLRLFEGLLDTLTLLSDTVVQHRLMLITQLQTTLERVYDEAPASLLVVQRALVLTMATAAELVVDTAVAEYEGEWGLALQRQAQDAYDELLFLVPWLSLLPVPDSLGHLDSLDKIPSLREVADGLPKILPALDACQQEAVTPAEQGWLGELKHMLALGSRRAAERQAACSELVLQASNFAAMHYGLLYDPARHLLAVGYNVDEFRRDPGFYDLLASEARLCSFIGIAQGQLPQESWFALGRMLTRVGGQHILVSWSGSMFEYLMPMLVM
ncbi:MAG: cyclic beta 1-2 glucan synthetase, partial [Pseudomonadales bacterium]|nr:cyclic beta 1-2 glucan synthetase [Pseudomonadales bacterium]